MLKTNSEKRERIIEYIKKHPRATYKEMRKKLKFHLHDIFNTIEEAYKEAGVKYPYKFKTKEERRKIIIDFIRKNPKVGGNILSKKTKINISTSFKNIEEAYKEAGVKYPRKIDKRSKEEKKKLIIEIVRKNPLITISEIMKDLELNPYKHFRDLKEIYLEAGINEGYLKEKMKLKKQKQAIEFIRQNPLATQREINKACKTHVQELFDKGIFDAYEKAGINFPFERLKSYGVGLKEIRERAREFESEIASRLSEYGKVNKFVKTKRGVADIIFERKGKKVIIEIKDYQNKDISVSQIRQLNKYLEDCNYNLGFLICRNKPKKDKFLIDKNKIIILNETELDKLCGFMDGTVVHWQ